MDTAPDLELFLVAVPGLEAALRDEAVRQGFRQPRLARGGVTVAGGWPEAWRANLVLRGASRVLVRLGAFRAVHLAQLDKRARRFPWGETLRADVAVRVEAACKASRIYHAGAAAQRIERAIAEELGAPIAAEAEIRILARIEDDLCTLSLDSSGEPLHRRGHKEAVAKAPLRETMAALFLRECGYAGNEPVVDPMCGSGTFVIEAAEIAAGLAPGRTRAFAFERLASFDAAAWARLRAPDGGPPQAAPRVRFHGFDRDAGAIRMSRANAERAGVSAFAEFRQQPISELVPPEGPPGLVIVNPPYGGRVGERKTLYPLYAALGQTLLERFSGWRVGLVANDESLAHATHLPWARTGAPVDHGGIKIRLHATDALG